MTRQRNTTLDVPSFWHHFTSYWTVSYFYPEREGEVKSWINQQYQVWRCFMRPRHTPIVFL